MEIIEEQIQLTYSAGRTVPRRIGSRITPPPALLRYLPLCPPLSGETKTTVSPHIPGGVSDGQWHVVEVHYYNKVGSGAGSSEGSLGWKRAKPILPQQGHGMTDRRVFFLTRSEPSAYVFINPAVP